MILAAKIIQLRKQANWSQEELADKMNVSRQSVSKWESTNSIPDLNKIIMLADLFEVSTDYLLRDELEAPAAADERIETNNIQVNLDHAGKYVQSKIEAAALTTKGVILCVCSVIPLFFLMAMEDTGRLNINGDIATAGGIMSILVMVSLGVSYFIKMNQYEADFDTIDNEKFELSYGVHSVFQEKLKQFRPIYNRRLSLGIFLFISSFAPLMLTAVLNGSDELVKLMLIVLMLMIAAGLYLVIPASTEYEAYSNILKENHVETVKSRRAKRAEKLAAFYWPLLVAIFLGWSLWTMDWGVTWIIWPVGAVLFGALIGLMELLAKDDN
ncbi:MAG: helix-turn-helix transcriptional regulator [Pseudomonadales bacterium]|jgi:transcriptional regulator with XRE-family HTH domain